MVPQGKLLGHIVCTVKLKTNLDKIRVITQIEAPQNIKGIKSFLGNVDYYRRFIINFAQISYPLDILTRKGQPFTWTEDHEKAFNELKV